MKRYFMPILTILVLALGVLTGCAAPLPSPTPTNEQAYLARIDALLDRFSNHKKEYTSVFEQIGAAVRSATTEAEHRKALDQAITHLKNAEQWFRQDRDDFSEILPPPRFREFHLLMNSALRDIAEATAKYVTYYSLVVNLGAQDLQYESAADGQFRRGGENLQRAVYMKADLVRNSPSIR